MSQWYDIKSFLRLPTFAVKSSSCLNLIFNWYQVGRYSRIHNVWILFTQRFIFFANLHIQ